MKWFKPDDSYHIDNTVKPVSSPQTSTYPDLFSDDHPSPTEIVTPPKSPSTSSNTHGQAQARMLESLQQIFPGRDPEELTQASIKHNNVNDAINDILDTAIDENISSSE